MKKIRSHTGFEPWTTKLLGAWASITGWTGGHHGHVPTF